MVCTHLKELYQLCESNRLRISSSDLVRITCQQCEEVETCPSMLMEEYDAHEAVKSNSDSKVEDDKSAAGD